MHLRPAATLLLLLLAPLQPARAADTFLDPAKIPQTLDQLWAGYDDFDRATPLEVEVLKEWDVDGVTCRVIRYQVGVFKGAPSRVAAFYAFPKGAQKLPAILDLHGGGQSASLDHVITSARRGYAGLSLNWGGNKLNFGRSGGEYDGPQTDWGNLDATHPPQRNKSNHFAGSLAPDDFTLDPVASPRNSNWFLVLVAARRALSVLERQPEVDPARIGVTGHSMGGKLTTNLAGIDPRVRASAPSCGGSGVVLKSQTDLPGCHKTEPDAFELACVSDNAYIPRIARPVLWVSPQNDFHAHIDNMAWNWRDVPDDLVRFSISPHFNHRHEDASEITRHLWFEEHLKGAFRMPRTPRLTLTLASPDGVPRVEVMPDAALPVRRVDVFYSADPHALTRFWRDAGAVKTDAGWTAACPVLDTAQPLFVHANVVYEMPAPQRDIPECIGTARHEEFILSSRVLSAAPAALQAAGVKATDAPSRLIDDGARGWHDWYLLNWGHPPLWTAATRKFKDPKWRGPDGATLEFDIRCPVDNTLVLTFTCNSWGAIQPGRPAVDYAVAVELAAATDFQTVSVRLADLVATDPKISAPLTDWRSVTEFSISPSGSVVRGGQVVKINGRPWPEPRALRNLRWTGGSP